MLRITVKATTWIGFTLYVTITTDEYIQRAAIYKPGLKAEIVNRSINMQKETEVMTTSVE